MTTVEERMDILVAMEKRLLRGQATAEQIDAERKAMIKPPYVNRGRGVQDPFDPRANNSSGARGVVRVPSGKWRASITIRGKRYELGLFNEFADAKLAYDEAYNERSMHRQD